MIFSFMCFAETQVDPFEDPKVKQEQLLVNYILDDVRDYVKSSNWVIWNPKTDNRANKIGDIIKKYEYSEDYYGVNISSLGEPNNGTIYYYVIDVCIFYKSNSDLSTCERLIIQIAEEIL
jgi:hypothetical protein